MEKTQKKIIGFFGLVLVIAMTLLAMYFPESETSAISTLTDTLTVKVISGVADVELISPQPGSVVTHADNTIKFSYSNIISAELVLIKKESDGSTSTHPIETYTIDDEYGERTINVDFQGLGLGYGDYVVTLRAKGASGTTDEDSIEFSYYPVTAEVTENEETGDIVVDLDYDPYNPDDPASDGEVAEVVINVYDENGNLVEELSPIVVTPPATEVEIPFSEHDLPGGTYTVKATAYDKDGNQLYEFYATHAVYNVVPVPNTGGLLSNLNISKADYLITGAIIFLLAGIFGVVFIAKRQKSSRRR